MGNYHNLRRVVLYTNSHGDVYCTGDYCSSVLAKYLQQFQNPIQSDKDIFDLYELKEIKDKGIILKDKIFSVYDFEDYIAEINKDNFVDICFADRHKNRVEKIYLKDEDFISRPTEDEIIVNVSGGNFYKTVHKNKKDEEYIKTGQMGYNSNVIYLTEKQKYIKNKNFKESRLKHLLSFSFYGTIKLSKVKGETIWKIKKKFHLKNL